MFVPDLIRKKRLGQALSDSEIATLVEAYTRGEVLDVQMSAWAMAVCLQGMTEAETTSLTLAMAHSGQVLDLSSIPGIKVDKHSTGGVGDTTTLVLAPWVAALGVPVAKMSGRGLGHTGGTIDKLESIPGFSCDLTPAEFLAQVQRIGIAVASQTADLAPADKKLYALRDLTDTVESVPLIASSVMSKKIASGADAIVLDVKVGQGAFMQDLASARSLATAMVAIGTRTGRRTVALLTAMDEPLGRAVGNALEVREAVLTLTGRGPRDLQELCLALGSEMLVLAGKASTPAAARALLLAAQADGRALAKWKEWVAAQGGDARVADDLSLLPRAPVVRPVYAAVDGVVQAVDARLVGHIAMRLGAGRSRPGAPVDPRVGVVLLRKRGEPVVRGEVIAEVHAADEVAAEQAVAALAAGFRMEPGEPFTPPLLLGRVAADGEEPRPLPSVAHSLLVAARQARETAYAPYSRFAVGAALLLSDGTVVTGANVENASFGLTVCAERTAMFQFVLGPARSRGARVQALAVVADSPQPVPPCGACRQVLAEWCGPDTPVWLGNLQGEVVQTTTGDLLPGAFTRVHLSLPGNAGDRTGEAVYKPLREGGE
ncbi:MAG: thymidine phosphorylase [Alicyclobacillus sp.]|nr:thymidine phosphorylase [Alicyclobacillus sp.]